MISALRPTLLALSRLGRTSMLRRGVAAFNDPSEVVHAAGALEGRKVCAPGLWSPVEFHTPRKGARARLVFDV